jgi:hypothetical protein
VKHNGYRSKFEAKDAPRLLAAGARYEAVKLRYPAGERVYTPDWILPNGIVVEFKGRFVSRDRAKMLAVRAAHPDLDIRFVLMRPSEAINKGSMTTHGEWCDKHGFLWAQSIVPDEWLRSE